MVCASHGLHDSRITEGDAGVINDSAVYDRGTVCRYRSGKLSAEEAHEGSAEDEAELGIKLEDDTDEYEHGDRGSKPKHSFLLSYRKRCGIRNME